MIKHNLLLTFRNFKRFKNSFFINLIGLSTGLACSMLIILWVTDELSVDSFHAKDKRLFQALEHQQYAEEIMTTTSTPGLLAETLKDQIPEVEYAATTTWVNNFNLSIGDHNIKAEGYYVGRDYFNIFSYELLHGSPDQVLADKNSMVISESTALSLFNTTEGIIGKEVEWQHEKTYLVSGVFKDIPESSSVGFDFVMSFEVFKDDNPWVVNWGSNGPKTFVVLHEGADYRDVNAKIPTFVNDQKKQTNVTLFLRPYATGYLHGRYEDGKLSGGRIEYVQLFSVVALFILLIACINFMNLSTARSSRRAKEVGIKKAIGAPKGSLVIQYLGESIIMSVLALVLAMVMIGLSIDQFNEITGKSISIGNSLEMIPIFLAITLVTGLIAGSYPAFYLSSFTITKVLKGELKGSLGELWARRGLVIFQFTLSIILIVSVLVIYRQIDFVQTKNLGYNKDNIVYFGIEGKVEEHLETALSEVRNIPGVIKASSIGHNLTGRQNNTSGLNWEGKNPHDKVLFENVRISHDLIETLGLELVEGRSFSREFSADTAKIIFNEAAIKVMGLEDPIGKSIRLWDEYDLEIIGVVKDFHFQSLHDNVNPLFLKLEPENSWNVMARVKAGQEKQTIADLENFYAEFNPGFEFEYQFLDEQYQRQYAAEQRVSLLSRYFAGIAILISCLGLFGLAAFTAERRSKEIGIRKVLGSSVMNIVCLLSKDFSRMVFMSILIALPLSYLLIKDWLDRFAYRIDLEIWFFIGAGATALIISWLTVGSQAIKAAHINPVECLRDE